MRDKETPPANRSRGIYLLPNLFTTAGLFSGFYAIVAAMKGLYDYAAIAIFIGMIMDALDGRVARMTNTESAFGSEYDSLSDMLTFGLAPSLVAYSWSLVTLGKIGWLAAFFYTAAGALRLARFNTQVETADKNYFQGLPIPAGAGILAGFVWLCYEYQITGSHISIITGFISIFVGLLMVSNVRYHSFKKLDLKGRVPFMAILVVVLLFVFISIDPPKVLFVGFTLYGLSGPVLTLYDRHKKRKRGRNKKASRRSD